MCGGFPIENVKGLDELLKDSDIHVSQGLIAFETGQLVRLRIEGFYGLQKMELYHWSPDSHRNCPLDFKKRIFAFLSCCARLKLFVPHDMIWILLN